jgi:23S rRNA (adenine2503-C2)-methyltransferase
MKVLTSNLDASVNFIENQLTGFVETRYVRRTEEYFIAYLSSQSGCNQGCRMCHLTATKQTQFRNCDQQDFVSQMETVLSHYEKDIPARVVHINWMARGEPLSNPTITKTGTELLLRLGRMVADRGLKVKFNISTIMPLGFRTMLSECFPMITPTIYYSIYSVDDSFRKKWLPAAMPVSKALENLAEYQRISKKIIKFHGAFIENENDREKDIVAMMSMIQRHGIVGEFNIVRYNPFSSEQGVESPCIRPVMQIINQYMPCKIIPRVGSDVFASCGTFIGEESI